MLVKKVAAMAFVFCFSPLMTSAQSLNEFESVPDDADAQIKRITVDSIIQQGDVNPMDQINFANPYTEQGCVQNVGSITTDNVTGDAEATGIVVGDVINICNGF